MNSHGKILLVSVVALTVLGMVVFPHGMFEPENVASVGGLEVLVNPDLKDNHVGWVESDWSSGDFYPTAAWYDVVGDKVSMGTSGDLPSFYAVALSQGAGPSEFRWDTRSLYVGVNGSCSNIVRWRGCMDYSELLTVGCLGMGIDFWFDAKLPNGTLAPVELYVFFYMEGVYGLPVGSYKSVVRSDYNHSSGVMGLAWDYLYFHHCQAGEGVVSEHSFELYDYVAAFKSAKPVYSDAEFFLTRVDACMELFMGSGGFTVDYVGLQVQAKT